MQRANPLRQGLQNTDSVPCGRATQGKFMLCAAAPLLIIHSCANTATCTFPTVFSNTVMSVYKYGKIIFCNCCIFKKKNVDGAKRTLAMGYYPRVSAVLPEKSKFHRKSYLPNSAMFVVLCCSTLVCVVHNEHAEQKHLVLFLFIDGSNHSTVFCFGVSFFGGGEFIEFMLQWMASQKKKREKERKRMTGTWRL